jgi:hypothetical protein
MGQRSLSAPEVRLSGRLNRVIYGDDIDDSVILLGPQPFNHAGPNTDPVGSQGTEPRYSKAPVPCDISPGTQALAYPSASLRGPAPSTRAA